MATAKIRTKSERTALINEFLASGMSKIDWCKENGIPYSTLYKWMKSYDQSKEAVKFISLTNKSQSVIMPTQTEEVINMEIASNDLFVEIGVCKVHICEATSLPLLTKLVKAVIDANV